MRRSSLYLPLVLVGLALVKGIVFSFFGLNFFDDGESLHNGTRLLEGATLYKDIWAFFPPLDNYFPALALAISNSHLLVLRFAEALLFAVLVGLLVWVSESFLSKPFIILAVLALIFSNLNVHLLFFQLFFFSSLVFVLQFIRTENRSWLFGSGSFLGLGALFRHDTGIVTALSILAILLLNSFISKKPLLVFRNLTVLLAGFLVIVTPVAAWLKNAGTLGEFLYLGFIKAPQISRILSPGFDLLGAFTPPFTYGKIFQQFTLFSYGLYVVIYALTGFYLYLRFRAKIGSRELFLSSLLIYGVSQIPYAFSVIEMGHLVKAGIPAFLLGAFLIQEGIYRRALGKYSWALGSPLIIFILVNLTVSFWWIRYNDTRVDFKQGFVFVNSVHIKGSTHPTAETLEKTMRFIERNTKEGDYIFAIPYHAMLYFLTERKAPSKFNNFAAGFVSKNEQKSVIWGIEDKNVQVVIYDPVNAPLDKRFKDYNPEIHAYIMDKFITVEETDMSWLLMRRKNE